MQASRLLENAGGTPAPQGANQSTYCDAAPYWVSVRQPKEIDRENAKGRKPEMRKDSTARWWANSYHAYSPVFTLSLGTGGRFRRCGGPTLGDDSAKLTLLLLFAFSGLPRYAWRRRRNSRRRGSCRSPDSQPVGTARFRAHIGLPTAAEVRILAAASVSTNNNLRMAKHPVRGSAACQTPIGQRLHR